MRSEDGISDHGGGRKLAGAVNFSHGAHYLFIVHVMPVVLIVVVLTLSGNTYRLNLNRSCKV